MALHADLHAEGEVEPGRIDDAGAHIPRCCGGFTPCGCAATWTMAALTIDSFGQVARKDGVAPRSFIARRNLRNPVVAKHALIRDEAAGSRMVRIGTGGHGPVATV